MPLQPQSQPQTQRQSTSPSKKRKNPDASTTSTMQHDLKIQTPKDRAWPLLTAKKASRDTKLRADLHALHEGSRIRTSGGVFEVSLVAVNIPKSTVECGRGWGSGEEAGVGGVCEDTADVPANANDAAVNGNDITTKRTTTAPVGLFTYAGAGRLCECCCCSIRVNIISIVESGSISIKLKLNRQRRLHR
ncbi:hypothetical protein M422DRAFT_254189 [Sphaerobolus stellatus SS14]|uniref:Unplaced genomic scaffold SPHSTscaffold_53, whole genome shotgun sequence n=1 Tax=Sphaerobolus stellatus (strain SS14) TaxID=990650 RepID=A0A0C9V6X7_SPHS4|nr:hypothetical protein M422DRAFT_254189 [Sphaerobolus stellatus SS14]